MKTRIFTVCWFILVKGRVEMLRRIKNRTVARIITGSRLIANMFIKGFKPLELDRPPWSPLSKPLSKAKVAMVTTAGVHHKDQKPFDMENPDGDPTYRVIDIESLDDLIITHDYYDHRDADKDINIVFPVQRLMELQKEGLIGELAKRHYGFMGHIVGQYISVLKERTAREVAKMLAEDGVDVVLLGPG